MRKQLRPIALFACLAVIAAFGSRLAAAETGAAAGAPEMGCAEQHRGHHGHHFFKKMARALGLTDQQKAQAKALFTANRAQNKPLFVALMTEKRQLRTLIMSGTADEAAIRAQSAKVAAAQADLAVKRAQGAKQFLALLTPDQVTKLRAIQAKRAQKYQECAPVGALPAE